MKNFSFYSEIRPAICPRTAKDQRRVGLGL
jgi:hypothetical protein